MKAGYLPGIKLTENQVEAQICDFLRTEGWHVTRQQSGLFRSPDGKRRIRIGEPGCTDWRAERAFGMRSGSVDLFYFEVKATGKKPSLEQMAWIRSRTHCGFVCCWFDSLDTFQAWYKEQFR